MAIEQRDLPKRLGKPADLEINQGCSTKDAFLLTCEGLADQPWEDYSSHGTHTVTCDRSDLPDELRNVADILGIKDDIKLIVRADTWLSNKGKNSVNEIKVHFENCGVSVVYRYDNGRRIFNREPNQRMSVYYAGVDRRIQSVSELKEQQKRPHSLRVITDPESAIRGLCHSLSQLQFET